MSAPIQKTLQALTLMVALPCVSVVVMECRTWRKELAQPHYGLATFDNQEKHVKTPAMPDCVHLRPYPITMESLLELPFGTLDDAGVPYNEETADTPAAYQPTSIAQYALAQWNAYLATGNEQHRDAFLIQARWLVSHETLLAPDMSGWPIPFPVHSYNVAANWLSALTQGNGISVLVRAYQLTQDDCFLQVARRALRTFEVDIRDGGVCATVGEDGIFFEEVANYPAAHVLNGYVLALFGLYDYVELTGDTAIAMLIERSLKTLHTFINDFDSGYWSRYDLQGKRLAPPFYHALHVTLLEALAHHSRCTHCALLAERWKAYQRSPLCQLRYFVATRTARYKRGYRRILSLFAKG